MLDVKYGEYIPCHQSEAGEYLESRGIPASCVDKWRLGVGTNYVDSPMLRDRLCVPIFGYTHLLAISGRALHGEMPKYWHNKFPKKKFIYGLHLTEYHDPCIITESFTDVWILDLLGYSAYAVMSTMLSKWQIAHIAGRHKSAIVYPHLDQIGTSNWCELLNRYGVKTVEPFDPYTTNAEPKSDSTWMYVNERDHLISELETCASMLKPKSKNILDLLRG